MTRKIVLLAAVSLSLVGCKETMPEVNRVNCQPENILKILDDEQRDLFTAKCRSSFQFRGGDFEPSAPKKWGY